MMAKVPTTISDNHSVQWWREDWAAFFGLLIGLPLLSQSVPSHALALFDRFYRSGALVFGGGHVVLPLLRAEVVPTGWVTDDLFLAGYGAAQAVPGPLFTFAGYLGAVMTQPPNGWLGAILCLVAIFLPSFLLVVGALQMRGALRDRHGTQAALTGINAGVVGLLLAALYDPVWSRAIHSRADFGLALASFILLTFWKISPGLVVGFPALGAGFSPLGTQREYSESPVARAICGDCQSTISAV
jgi:chromate transporter